MQTSLQLSTQQVHIWIADLAQPAELAGRLEQMLCPDERRRAARWCSEAKRRRFVVSHAALRIVLGHHLQKEANEVEISLSEAGKPYLADSSGVSFNMSHSHELAVIAVTRDRNVGIDIEYVTPQPRVLWALRPYLSADEVVLLSMTPPGERNRRMLGYWVAREAVFKAFGRGGSWLPDSCSVPLEDESACTWRGLLSAEGANRLVRPIHVDDAYVGALAIEGSEPSDIAYFRWPPESGYNFGMR
jgi:4'-phosphopantetheinyl transferase